jgi:hypothetical protein
VNHRLAAGGMELVILAEATVTAQPAEGPLDDPSVRQDFESLEIIVAFYDLEPHLGAFAQIPEPIDELACVAAISPDEAEAMKLVLEPFEDQRRAITVLEIAGMNQSNQDQAHHIDEQMSFTPIDLLAGVVAVRSPFSVVLTDCESITPALGCRCRPAASRTSPRSLS